MYSLEKQAIIKKIAVFSLASRFILRQRAYMNKKADAIQMTGPPTQAPQNQSFNTMMSQAQRQPQSYRMGQEAVQLPNYKFQSPVKPSRSDANTAASRVFFNNLGYGKTVNGADPATWQIAHSGEGPETLGDVARNAYYKDYLPHTESGKYTGYSPIINNASNASTLNLSSYLLGKGMPTRAPYASNIEYSPSNDSTSAIMFDSPSYNPSKPSTVALTPNVPLNVSGHEAGHSMYERGLEMFNPNYENIHMKPTRLLSGEAGASLMQAKAMNKALEPRPDLQERYNQQAMRTVLPAWGTYATAGAPGVLAQGVSAVDGAKRALLGLATPQGRTLKGMKKNYNSGAQSAFNFYNPVFSVAAFPASSAGNRAMIGLMDYNIKANKEEDASLKKDISDFTKQYYGSDSEVPWVSKTDPVNNYKEVASLGLNANRYDLDYLTHLADKLHENEPRYRQWVSGWDKNLGGEPEGLSAVSEDKLDNALRYYEERPVEESDFVPEEENDFVLEE